MSLHIYLCAFINEHYIEEAKVCIKSIRTNGKFSGTIYLFTDLNVVIPDVTIIKSHINNVYESASYRTRIFEHIKDLSVNDRLLYLDTDIVILNPIPSFDNIDNKINIYGYPHRTQDFESFSGFITNDKKYIDKTAICSGIMLFRPSKDVINFFNDTYKLYTHLINCNKVNNCWEQPALCFKLIEHDIYNMSLNDLVYEERSYAVINDSVIFNHFCGLRGIDRYINMKKYIDNFQ
jgi:hypothetical protein|tara:strand:- start:647 stop:1351 length:705 start_codon:yes stop_codon:yes gene_type:complete